MRTNIPSGIVTGLKVEWTKTITGYGPDEWSLSYHLRGENRLDVTATDNEDGSFLISFVAETDEDTPAPLTTGAYFFQAYLTNIADTTNKFLFDSGRVNVIANLADTSLETFDGRSRAELMVTAIDALLAGKATNDQMGYTIGQRTLTRIPPDQLIQWRNHYASIVEAESMRERQKKGLPVFENIHVKFTKPR